MFCNKCGRPLKEDARFCTACGNAVRLRTVTVEPSSPNPLPVTSVWEPKGEPVPAAAPAEYTVERMEGDPLFPEWAEEDNVQETADLEEDWEVTPEVPLSNVAEAVEAYEAALPDEPWTPAYMGPADLPAEPPVYVPVEPPAYHPVMEPVYSEPSEQPPAYKLPTNRSLVKMIFLGILTLGIYDLVILSRLPGDLNLIASRHDGRRTMDYFAMILLSGITLGIVPLVWYTRLCSRAGTELERRGIAYRFGPSCFWLWNILGALILVGPYIFLHKLMKTFNLLSADYNKKG